MALAFLGMLQGLQILTRAEGKTDAFAAAAAAFIDSMAPVPMSKVFFTNDDGETFVLKAGPKLEILRVNRLNARTLASPALVDGRWYFRTDRELICIGS